MAHLRRGLIAGFLAGLLMALVFFVDYGPGANLSTIARWFSLSGIDANKLIGFVLLVVLGAVFGLLFGAVLGRRIFTTSQSVLAGLVTGFVWWVVMVVLLGTAIQHVSQSPYSMMLFLMVSLLYGLTLGSLYIQWPGWAERKERG